MKPEDSKRPAPFVIRSTSKRDTLIAILIATVLLGFLAYGIFHMSQPVQGNQLTGTIVAKQFTPLKEQLIDFDGRKLKGARESEGEYVLKVRVDADGGRVYEVPVTKALFEGKKEGDNLTFIRPRSEQK
jgi:ABC-type Na+ efflux pump permease subunit